MPRTKLPIWPRRKPPLRIGDILRWADDYHRRKGRWPYTLAGRIPGTADQTWAAVDQALRAGHRGLPGGSSLAKLLLQHRGIRHPHYLPALTIPQILTWADAHHARTRTWPSGHSTKTIPNAPKGLTWVAVNLALARGKRGLPGGSSLADLLETHRGVRNRKSVPDLTEAQVLAWADDHHARTGNWPKYKDGSITAAPGETWCAVDTALSKGKRGFSGGDSLARFLTRHREVRNKSALPRLTVEQIRVWAQAHRKRTGRWPVVKSGPIPEAAGETWSGVNQALYAGQRGLPGGSSLYQMLHNQTR